MRRWLTDLDTSPRYNMKAVEHQTGISAPTLRAWERRYHLIAPNRTDSGYRLYSEQDLALLQWVRCRIDEGLTIGRIAALVDTLRANGETLSIEDAESTSSAEPVTQAPISPEALIAPLYDALVERDTQAAEQIFARAHALYPLPVVFKDLIAPTLAAIGEAWHHGEILISVEHFASNYVRGRLLALLQSFSRRDDAAPIIVACAPHETHEIGALMLAVLLAQDGFNVIYLGQDTPLDDLILTAKHDHPAVICLSAQSKSTAESLKTVQDRLQHELGAPPPYFVFGGRSFDQDAALCAATPGYYFGNDPREIMPKLRHLVNSGERAPL